MKAQTTGRILLYSLCRRADLIIFINVVILGIILVGSWLWPPVYQASSSVAILGRTYPDLLTPPGRGAPGSSLILNPKDELNTEMEIIRSRPVLERVVKELKLDSPRKVTEEGVAGAIRDVLRAVLNGVRALSKQFGLSTELTPEETFEAAVSKLHNDLVVDPASDSQIIWIRYRSRDPVLVSKVVNKVAEEYQHQHLAININRAESSFYAEQITHVENDLKGLQGQLMNLKLGSGIVSFSEQSKALLKKMETYDNSLTNVQKEIIRIRSKVDKIHNLRKSRPNLLIPLPEMSQDPQLSDMENKLLNLQFALKTVLQRYTSESRQAQIAREQISHLKVQIRQHVDTVLEREMAKLRELQAEEQAINQTIKGLKEELAQLPGTEMGLSNLEREIDTKQGIMSILMKKYQDTLLAKSVDQRLENAKILSLAAVPLKPIFPKPVLNLALGLVFSLVVSIGTAFFLEYWDDSLKYPEDVERYLGLTVLGSVPEL
ncbi:MAG: GumC family protein [Thermodesulfobacteriota bacterium]